MVTVACTQDRVHYLWDPKSSRQDYEKALSGIATCVTLMLSRLEAEFPKGTLESCLDVFDVSHGTADRASHPHFEAKVGRLLKEGLQAPAAEIRPARRQFIASWHRVRSQKRLGTDNRVLWFEERAKQAENPWWRLLISFYLSLEDGAGNVERAHGTGKRILDSHAGPLEEAGVTYSDLLTLKLDGPRSLSELAEQTADCALGLTSMSREFLEEWRCKHGARFRVYNKKMSAERPKQTKAKPSKQLKALDLLAQKREAAPSSTPTILPSLNRGQAAKLLVPGPMDTKGLKQFRLRTALIRKNVFEVNKRRQNPADNPFGEAKVTRANVFTAKPRIYVSLEQSILDRKRLKIVDACSSSAPMPPSNAQRDIRVRRCDDASGGFVAFCLQSHLIILDSVDSLGSHRPDELLGIYAIASFNTIFHVFSLYQCDVFIK